MHSRGQRKGAPSENEEAEERARRAWTSQPAQEAEARHGPGGTPTARHAAVKRGWKVRLSCSPIAKTASMYPASHAPHRFSPARYVPPSDARLERIRLPAPTT